MESKLRNLIKESMIEKRNNRCKETELRYQTLKNILEASQKAAKDKQEVLTDSYIIAATKKEIKQLNDLLEFCKNNEEKKYETEYCIKVANEMLPEMISEEEICKFVDENKTEYNNIGLMMKALKIKFGDQLDGKIASKIVKEKL